MKDSRSAVKRGQAPVTVTPQEAPAAVDVYLDGSLFGDDAVLAQALEDSRAAGLPPINVTRSQGKLLYLLARLQHAARVLEIGTLGGYSTIWLARALPPGGRAVTLESEATHADVARKNLARAGLLDRVEIRVGPALETLVQLRADGEPPFDMIFIDADKPQTPEYIDAVLPLSRPGTLLIVDNVVRGGEIANAASTDPSVQGMQRAVQLLATHPRLDATVIQTVGAKGYDGFALALVRD